VLRVHDHAGRDLAGRLDGNAVQGRIPVEEVLSQMERGEAAFSAAGDRASAPGMGETR